MIPGIILTIHLSCKDVKLCTILGGAPPTKGTAASEGRSVDGHG